MDLFPVETRNWGFGQIKENFHIFCLEKQIKLKNSFNGDSIRKCGLLPFPIFQSLVKILSTILSRMVCLYRPENNTCCLPETVLFIAAAISLALLACHAIFILGQRREIAWRALKNFRVGGWVVSFPFPLRWLPRVITKHPPYRARVRKGNLVNFS